MLFCPSARRTLPWLNSTHKVFPVSQQKTFKSSVQFVYTYGTKTETKRTSLLRKINIDLGLGLGGYAQRYSYSGWGEVWCDEQLQLRATRNREIRLVFNRPGLSQGGWAQRCSREGKDQEYEQLRTTWRKITTWIQVGVAGQREVHHGSVHPETEQRHNAESPAARRLQALPVHAEQAQPSHPPSPHPANTQINTCYTAVLSLKNTWKHTCLPDPNKRRAGRTFYSTGGSRFIRIWIIRIPQLILTPMEIIWRCLIC